MELTNKEFLHLRGYIHKLCGILVDENKEYLIKQRLEPIVEEFGYKSFAELCEHLSFPPIGLREKIIIAITTNETFFFRDGGPFDTFKKYLIPDLAKLIIERKNKSFMRKGAKVRIWCVACSTGQEPYSLAMLINEFCATTSENITMEDFSILTTDINTDVLAQAMQGRYNQLEVNRGLDESRLAKYFRQDGNDWFISNELQSIIEFKKLNLADSFLSLGGFDIILCRNVLIYFDDKTKTRILNEIHHLLSEDGTLLLGSSENIYGLCDNFKSTNVDGTLLFKKS